MSWVMVLWTVLFILAQQLVQRKNLGPRIQTEKHECILQKNLNQDGG